MGGTIFYEVVRSVCGSMLVAGGKWAGFGGKSRGTMLQFLKGW